MQALRVNKPAGLSFQPAKLSTVARLPSSFTPPSGRAFRLRPCWVGGLRRILMYYLSRSPFPTPLTSWRYQPSLPPDWVGICSGFFSSYAFSSGGQVRLRSAPAVFNPPQFWESAGKQGERKGGKERLGRLILSVALLTGSYLTCQGDFNFGRLSLSFGLLQSLRSFTWINLKARKSFALITPSASFRSPLSVERLPW